MQVKIDNQILPLKFERKIEPSDKLDMYLKNEEIIKNLQSQQFSYMLNNCLINTLEVNYKILSEINMIDESTDSQIQYLDKMGFYLVSLYKAFLSIEHPNDAERLALYNYKKLAKEYSPILATQVEQQRNDYEYGMSLVKVEAVEIMDIIERVILENTPQNQNNYSKQQVFFKATKSQTINHAEMPKPGSDYDADFDSHASHGPKSQSI